MSGTFGVVLTYCLALLVGVLAGVAMGFTADMGRHWGLGRWVASGVGLLAGSGALIVLVYTLRLPEWTTPAYILGAAVSLVYWEKRSRGED